MNKSIVKGAIGGAILAGLGAAAGGFVLAFGFAAVGFVAKAGALIGVLGGGVCGAGLAVLNAETNERGHHSGAAFKTGLAATLATLVATASFYDKAPVRAPVQNAPAASEQFNLRCSEGAKPVIEKTARDSYTVRIPATCRKVA